MVRVTINENLCKGCGLCVRACPKHIIALSKTKINAKGYHPAEVTDMELTYTNEFHSGFSFQLTTRLRKDESSHLIPFVKPTPSV